MCFIRDIYESRARARAPRKLQRHARLFGSLRILQIKARWYSILLDLWSNIMRSDLCISCGKLRTEQFLVNNVICTKINIAEINDSLGMSLILYRVMCNN